MHSLAKAAHVLKDNGIVIFPTDTVFGIGCIIGSQAATEKLYKIRKRDKQTPTLILVKDYPQAKEYAQFNKTGERIVKSFWPGALTLVTKAKKSVPELIQGPNKTIGVRQPKFEPLQKVLSIVGEPILAPSANFTGERAPKKLSEIDKNLIKLVDYVLHFECGGSKPSTVVEISNSSHLILREGQISNKKILEKLEES